MGSNRNGFNNEKEINEYINDKRWCELNSNIQNFLCFIFDDIKEDDIFKSEKYRTTIKPDLYIKNERTKIVKNISVKCGNGNSVHQEKIDDFAKYLIELGFDNNFINDFKFMHWKDETCDNTGKVRYSSNKWNKKYSKEIEKINSELNDDDKLIKFINRFLWDGKDPSKPSAEIIYHGDVIEGVWGDKNEINNYLLKHKNDIKRGIHFSLLTHQVWNPCLNWNQDKEDRRNSIQIKFGSIQHVLKEITNERKHV